MALRLWLPLIGDLDNKGISNVTVTNYGATVSNFGKIGKCYSFDGTDDYFQLTNIDLKGLPELSIACWIYPNDSTNHLLVFRSGSYHELSISGTGFNWRDTNNTSSLRTYTFTALPANTWTHLVCIYNRGEVFVYQNGVLNLHNASRKNSSSTLRNNWSEYRIGRIQSSSGNVYFNGKLNDFRIYDHCLSAKEVKEISKGLAVHFKLDSASQRTDNLVWDSSGYSHNGTGTRNKMSYSTSTPRYTNSINKTTSYVFCRVNAQGVWYNKANAWMAQGATELTINLWAKSSDWLSNNDRLFSCTQAGGFTIYYSSQKLCFEIAKASSAEYSSYTYVDTPTANRIDLTVLEAGWHMFTFVVCPSCTKIYVDGEKYSESVATFPYGIFYNLTGSSLNLGAESASASSAASPWFYGGESDFRLYYTALSEDDIKELYDVSEAIDDNGNLYAYEFVEDSGNSFTKTGKVVCTELIENGSDITNNANGWTANQFIEL